MNKIIGKTEAKPRAGETHKDDNVMVRPQNVDLADQGKAPGQKQNTSTDGKKNEAATPKRERRSKARVYATAAGVWWYQRV